MRHNRRTGVSEGSCFIFFDVPNESTPVFIPINPKKVLTATGPSGASPLPREGNTAGGERKRGEGKRVLSTVMMMGIMGVAHAFLILWLTYADESAP